VLLARVTGDQVEAADERARVRGAELRAERAVAIGGVTYLGSALRTGIPAAEGSDDVQLA
jgi:hypothetical protein